MSFDLSRMSFDPLKDYLGVVMQQGRVQLDADWNEAVQQITRRVQAEALDTLGPAVVPRETADGFLITLSGASFDIGAGRIYVDGLLAENHQEQPIAWDRRLAEERGTGAVDYLNQPYLPNPPGLPDQGAPYLVYLDVWRRAVTPLQDPELVEKAVGVDTTGRMQTVWQVKILEDIGNITPATPEDQIPGWLEETHPSSGRLSTRTGDPPDDPDPCLLPPAAGYRGLENQLYRVEIHDGGDQQTATFKWSRDNATVTATVTAIPELGRILVDSIGRDEVLRFNDGDWIEILDDEMELKNRPGLIRRIQLGGGVDAAARSLSLEEELPAGSFPVDGQGLPDPTRHTRIRRWDQAGMVREADGSDHHDLDLATSSGVIPLPAAGSEVFLEDGILVSFDLEPTGESFDPVYKSGDYWLFAARSADASLEILDRAPPLDTHHHYAKLALVDGNGNANDCRVLWPPVIVGESCDCTVCVHPESHNDGSATIQQAIDAIAAEGGTICLSAGTYRINEPLRIANAGSIRIRGQGWRSILMGETPGDMVTIVDSIGVALENLTVISSAGQGGSASTIAANNVSLLEVTRCNLMNVAVGDATSRAIQLTGYALVVTIRDSVLLAERGIEGPTGEDPLGTLNVKLENCICLCTQRAVSFEGMTFHLNQTRVRDCLLMGSQQGALVFTGAVLAGDLRIEDNAIMTNSDGIVAGVDGLRILSNDIYGNDEGRDGSGIVLVTGLIPTGIDKVQVIGNCISRRGGHGIAVRTQLDRAMVKQNQIDRVEGAAFVMEEGGGARLLSFENNQIERANGRLNAEGSLAAGIFLQAVGRGDIKDNVLSFVARNSDGASLRGGLITVACQELSIVGNRLFAIGPDSFGGLTAGVAAIGPAIRVAVDGNSISRSDQAPQNLSVADWRALVIGLGPSSSPGAGVEAAAANVSSVLVAGGAVLAGLRNSVAFATAERLTILQPILDSVSVSGNYLFGEAAAQAFVFLRGARGILMTGNDCNGVTQTPRAQPVVAALEADTVAASNNRMIGLGDLDSMTVQSQTFTVLGNISSGNIRVNGSALPAPWAALNVIV
ncbi:MAG: DUF6519 domain-containing protein [Kiloniellales bacterium]